MDKFIVKRELPLTYAQQIMRKLSIRGKDEHSLLAIEKANPASAFPFENNVLVAVKIENQFLCIIIFRLEAIHQIAWLLKRINPAKVGRIAWLKGIDALSNVPIGDILLSIIDGHLEIIDN